MKTIIALLMLSAAAQAQTVTQCPPSGPDCWLFNGVPVQSGSSSSEEWVKGVNSPRVPFDVKTKVRAFLEDEDIDKIADAVVRKLRESK